MIPDDGLITPEQYDRLARSDCFVCRIVAGNPLVANPHIVYEDDSVIAFLNQFPSQEAYTLVCPKRHAERYETELSPDEWSHLQAVVQRVSRAVSAATHAIRMYVASLGSPERNAHLHIHVCPCPPGTPFRQQQFAAMELKEGRYLNLPDERMRDIAAGIRAQLRQPGD
jgi:diadenosine tetraphosphate (Ap4A) HIT family hydrolase